MDKTMVNIQRPSEEKIISSKGLRIALGCPVAVAFTTFKYNEVNQRYMLNFALEHTKTTGADFNKSDTMEIPDFNGDVFVAHGDIESVSVAIRFFDSFGNTIRPSENSEFLTKKVVFESGEFPLGKSRSFSMKLALNNVNVNDVEISVLRINFRDLSFVDYERDAFFYAPAPPVLLEDAVGIQNADRVRKRFGDKAVYLPEKVSTSVYRCCCGELCTGNVCRECGIKKKDLFESVVVPTIDLRLSQDKTKTKTIGWALAFICIALALLVAAMVITLSDKPEATVTTVQTTTSPVTSAPATNEYELLARAYLRSKDFTRALEVAIRSPGDSSALVAEIILGAINHYTEQKDCTNALLFARKSDDPELISDTLEQCYRISFDSQDYDFAYIYATELDDKQLINESANSLVTELLSENKYAQAFEISNEISNVELMESIIDVARIYYVSKNDYIGAYEFVKNTSDTEKLTLFCKNASDYYIGIDDYVSALKFAHYSNDEQTMKDLCEGLDSSLIKADICTYFPYLSTEMKRELLATPISAYSFAAVIKPLGVVYGANEKFNNSENLKAVSVSCGFSHTVILLSDGSCVAFGDNTFGQCNVESFEDVIAVSAGRYHTVLLTSDGKLHAVGKNTDGQCNVSQWSDVISVSAGRDHTVALTINGKVLATGKNTAGQCNVSSWENIIAISAGGSHTLALQKDKTVVACGDGSLEKCNTSAWKNVVAITASESFSAAITADGKILSCGGTATSDELSVSGYSDVLYIEAADTWLLIYDKDGKIYTEGEGSASVDHLN